MGWISEDEDPYDAYWREKRERQGEDPHTLERWFKRRVRAVLYPEGVPWGWSERAAVALSWYWDHRDSFLRWRDAATFAGEGYSSGDWRIDEAAVQAAMPYAARGDSIAEQVEHFLKWGLEKREGVAEEPSGHWLNYQRPALSRREQAARERKHRRQRDRWPRACDQCGEVFVPTTKRMARAVTTCDSCKGRR